MGKSYNGADNIAIISPESSTNLCSILSITSQEYADFLVKHANELDPYLILIKPSEIRGDEEYVCKVLRMIVNQSIKLDKEIEIPSCSGTLRHTEKYISISVDGVASVH